MGQFQGGVADVTPPEIVDSFLDIRGLILNQFALEQRSCFKSEMLQHALTETMNGKNGCAIEIEKGCANAVQDDLLITRRRDQRRGKRDRPGHLAPTAV